FDPVLKLGVYDEVALVMLDGRPYGPHWEQLLRRLDIQTLFKLSLRSREMFVSSWLRFGGTRDRLSKVPVELFPAIFACITMADRISLSRTSRKFRALFARELQAVVTRTLRKFQMVYYEIRFMQTATMTVLSGPLVSHLLEYRSPVTHHEFYTPASAYPSVLRFFELATVFVGTAGRCNRGMDGTSAATTFFIRLWLSTSGFLSPVTDSALSCVLYAPLSHLFGAVTHYGLWLGYPDTGASGLTFPNRECSDLSTSHTRQFFHWLCPRLYRLVPSSVLVNRSHVCGVFFECPMTPRTTVDAGRETVFPRCSGVARWMDHLAWKAEVQEVIRAVSWKSIGDKFRSLPLYRMAVPSTFIPMTLRVAQAHVQYLFIMMLNPIMILPVPLIRLGRLPLLQHRHLDPPPLTVTNADQIFSSLLLSSHSDLNVFMLPSAALKAELEKHHISGANDLSDDQARYAILSHLLCGACIGTCDNANASLHACSSHIGLISSSMGLPSASSESRDLFLTYISTRRRAVVDQHSAANPALAVLDNVDKLPKGSLISLAQSHGLSVHKKDSFVLLNLAQLRRVVWEHLGAGECTRKESYASYLGCSSVASQLCDPSESLEGQDDPSVRMQVAILKNLVPILKIGPLRRLLDLHDVAYGETDKSNV
ncbi:hypothetical protein B0H13DRAFT_1887270, partial [Mycena leptocephala]